jgi:hypothetical protein
VSSWGAVHDDLFFIPDGKPPNVSAAGRNTGDC